MLTLKLKSGAGWQIIALPPQEKLSAAVLRTWEGTPCVLQFEDVNKTIYAYGNEDVRGKWEQGKIVMGMDTFADFWMYKLLELGLDTFAKVELRGEREAIMAAEGESPADVLASRPDLYQTEIDYVVPSDF